MNNAPLMVYKSTQVLVLEYSAYPESFTSINNIFICKHVYLHYLFLYPVLSSFSSFRVVKWTHMILNYILVSLRNKTKKFLQFKRTTCVNESRQKLLQITACLLISHKFPEFPSAVVIIFSDYEGPYFWGIDSFLSDLIFVRNVSYLYENVVTG